MKIDNKQTAVDFIFKELAKLNIKVDDATYLSVVRIEEQAQDMFQEQIQDAWTHGAEHWDVEMEGNDYYNETFGDSK